MADSVEPNSPPSMKSSIPEPSESAKAAFTTVPTTRTPLSTSLSFTESSSSTPSPSIFTLKRSYSTSSDLFTTSAASFHPVAPSKARATTSAIPRTHPHLRTDPHALLSAVMDPSPNDPNTIFLRPPFSTFPGSEKCPEGLTYNLMADNPGWFLDPTDFVSYEETIPANPNAIPYPTSLEPPRGWCPARKRDLKTRGPDGWPEGEEPRLRCTFCRRTYAGVNAKSMWRRHVFEKHKIAMANRREGPDRPRGRGSGATKENRQPKHDRLVNIEVVPQGQEVNGDSSQKSRFRSTMLPPGPPVPDPPSANTASPESSSKGQSSSSSSPPTPPLTPHAGSSDPASGSDDVTQTPNHALSSPVYDPSLTPSFRHTSPTCPSQRPWIWDSPSNSQRDMALTSITGELSTKSLDSPLLSLGKGFGLKGAANRSPTLTLGTPESNVKARRFPRLSHLMGSPFASSPLSRRPFSIHKKTFSEVSDDWPLDPASPLPSDPFIGGAVALLPRTPAESPVIRRDAIPKHGLGIGLLEPFTLDVDPTKPAGDKSLNDEHEMEVDSPGSLANSPSSTPYPKRRRISGPSPS